MNKWSSRRVSTAYAPVVVECNHARRDSTNLIQLSEMVYPARQCSIFVSDTNHARRDSTNYYCEP